MQREHRLNGYSYQDFDNVGIPASKLYYHASRSQNEKELSKKAFEIKFGKTYSGYRNSIINYYLIRMRNIAKKPLWNRAKLITKIKSDMYLSCQYFNINLSEIDSMWEEIAAWYNRQFE